MKLTELYKVIPKFAWFEPAKNGSGIEGVRLAFIEPTMPRFDSQIEDAISKKDKNRKERVMLKKQNYEKQGLKSFPKAPDLGWWLSKKEFDDGKNNEKGFTKGNVYQKHPDLEIFNSRKEAEKAAAKAGQI